MPACDSRGNRQDTPAVKRPLLPSSAFVRAVRRMLKKQLAAAAAVQSALELLANDAHDDFDGENSCGHVGSSEALA